MAEASPADGAAAATAAAAAAPMPSMPLPPKIHIHNSHKRNRLPKTAALDHEECHKLSQVSLSCQMRYPERKHEMCVEQMQAYRTCLAEKRQRKKDEAAAAGK